MSLRQVTYVLPPVFQNIIHEAPLYGWLISLSDSSNEYPIFKTNTIGKNDGNILIDDPELPLEDYAMITYKEDKNALYLVPTQKDCSILLNALPVQEPSKLESYDMIHIGSMSFVFLSFLQHEPATSITKEDSPISQKTSLIKCYRDSYLSDDEKHACGWLKCFDGPAKGNTYLLYATDNYIAHNATAVDNSYDYYRNKSLQISYDDSFFVNPYHNYDIMNHIEDEAANEPLQLRPEDGLEIDGTHFLLHVFYPPQYKALQYIDRRILRSNPYKNTISVGSPSASREKNHTYDTCLSCIPPVCGMLVCVTNSHFAEKIYPLYNKNNRIGSNPEYEICLAEDPLIFENASVSIDYDPVSECLSISPSDHPDVKVCIGYYPLQKTQALKAMDRIWLSWGKSSAISFYFFPASGEYEEFCRHLEMLMIRTELLEKKEAEHKD